MDDCIFCRIVKKEIPADICYEDEEILAFKDINPMAPVHILVIPKTHIASLNDIQPEHTFLLGKICTVLQQIAVQTGIAESGYRMFYNVGADGGQVVLHLHAHLIGGRKLKLEV